MIGFLELLKFRFESYEAEKNKRKPISCNDVIRLARV
jgi:hypothetical protein